MDLDLRYETGNALDLDAVIELYRASTLGERRPVDDREAMRDMLENANLVVSAWEGGQLLGISRALTDYSFTTYLADLAVRASHQKQGIGRELVRRTQAAAPRTRIVLLAAPKAVEYYSKLGFERHESAWTLAAGAPVL